MSVHDTEAVTGQPAIALVRDLCAALEADGVRYCHWKSNAFLDRSRTAENDLDLLVARADEDRFAEIMHRLGFKLAWGPSPLPGVLDFYGYDAEAERLVHVHAHYQLIVGDDLTKSYRIPLEDAFLDAAELDREFRVPPRELELILLVVRLVLKHLTWDAVLARRSKVPASARAELAFLQARVDQQHVSRQLEQWLPFVASQTFSDCERALAPDAGRGEGIRAGQRLVAALAPCARRSRTVDVCLKLWRRGTGIAQRLLFRPVRRKRLAAGGAVIAIVGADGAGKSTAVEALTAWLVRTFAVTCVHLGKPPASWTTVVDRRRSLAGGRRCCGFRAASALGAGRRAPPAGGAGGRPGPRPLPHLLRARRIATNGNLVICDRFPLPQLTLMDAPRVTRIADPDGWNRLTRGLAALEQRYYRAMTRPDVLIVLRVDPETAEARKPHEAAEFVRARWRGGLGGRLGGGAGPRRRHSPTGA